MNKQKQFQYFLILLISLLFYGCGGIPESALRWDKETLKDRHAQTRSFDTSDEGAIISACAALLQDLGFTLEESEVGVGMLLGSKDRTAVKGGQVATAIFIALLGGGATPIDNVQKMRASVITRPSGDKKSILVRVTFQRMVWNTQGQVSKSEPIKGNSVYQEFFSKLSKAIFLEAHEIL